MAEPPPVPPSGYPNLPLPTMGGMQLWTDHRWWHGWRIQRNVVSGHWRLLDSKNFRRAWGNRQACDVTLQSLLLDHDRTPPPEVVVICLHGLMRTSRSMSKIANELEKAKLGTIVLYEYASTRGSIADHAQALGELVQGLPGNPELVFVGHSLGNIVARYLMGEWRRSGRNELYGKVRAMVMFGPPNQGAEIAKNLGKISLFEVLTGRSGMELGPAWESIANQLDHPTCPVLIVAGDRSQSPLQNPIVRGPSDFVVRLEEVQLEGAEVVKVPGIHSFLMDIQEGQEAAVKFLQKHLSHRPHYGGR